MKKVKLIAGILVMSILLMSCGSSRDLNCFSNSCDGGRPSGCGMKYNKTKW